MNHQKIYDKIIEEAKSKNRKKLKKNNIDYIYYENHHILPRCLGGLDVKENFILLTAREHYICHKLLTYIYKGNSKISCAFHRMTNDKKGLKLSSRDYKYSKEMTSGENNPFFDKHHSSKTKEIIRIKKTGKKLSEDHCKNISKGLIGNTHVRNHILTEKHKDKIRKSLEGIKRSDDAKENYRKSKIGKKHRKQRCPYCNKEIALNNYKRYHGKNCKFFN